MLQAAVADAKAQSDGLNLRYFQYQQLKHDAEADKKLYEELQRKIQEAGINAGFKNNNVRIADAARTGAGPIFPNPMLNVVLAFLLSSLVGIVFAGVHDAMDTTLADPDQTIRVLGTAVIGVLPTVKKLTPEGILQAARHLPAIPGPGVTHPILARAVRASRSIQEYGEAIRSLRNTITLGPHQTPIRSILITSPNLGEGKTATAVSLALASALQGKKTLLIDADLRRPSVHHKLGIESHAGLSEILTGRLGWKEAATPVSNRPDLSVILSGTACDRAFETMETGMATLLTGVVHEYDMVIVDAPPLLGFAESLHLATVTDGVVIVASAKKTSRKDIGAVFLGLRRLRATVLGVVLNEASVGTTGSYYYYGSCR
jgi:capsular exopolysaccharide synthesis family protein